MVMGRRSTLALLFCHLIDCMARLSGVWKRALLDFWMGCTPLRGKWLGWITIRFLDMMKIGYAYRYIINANGRECKLSI